MTHLGEASRLQCFRASLHAAAARTIFSVVDHSQNPGPIRDWRHQAGHAGQGAGRGSIQCGPTAEEARAHKVAGWGTGCAVPLASPAVCMMPASKPASYRQAASLLGSCLRHSLGRCTECVVAGWRTDDERLLRHCRHIVLDIRAQSHHVACGCGRPGLRQAVAVLRKAGAGRVVGAEVQPIAVPATCRRQRWRCDHQVCRACSRPAVVVGHDRRTAQGTTSSGVTAPRHGRKWQHQQQDRHSACTVAAFSSRRQAAATAAGCRQQAAIKPGSIRPEDWCSGNMPCTRVPRPHLRVGICVEYIGRRLRAGVPRLLGSGPDDINHLGGAVGDSTCRDGIGVRAGGAWDGAAAGIEGHGRGAGVTRNHGLDNGRLWEEQALLADPQLVAGPRPVVARRRDECNTSSRATAVGSNSRCAAGQGNGKHRE